MGKRIIISEHQYGRIFLNEQRNTIRSKDSIKGYIDFKGKYQGGGQLQSQHYKKHIKTKEDGDNFREWVYRKKSRLNDVNNRLKSLGLKDGFSKSGPYGNTHFLVAWEMLGLLYSSELISDVELTSDVDRFSKFNMSTSDIDTLYSIQLLEKHIKTKEDGDNFREWVLGNRRRKDELNDEYNDLGYSDVLDPKGDIDNKHFKVAWEKYGIDYINKSGFRSKYLSSEEWIKNITNSIVDKDDNKEYKDKFKKWVETEFVNNEWIVTYNKSLNVWGDFGEDRGWNTEKSVIIDNEGIQRVLNHSISPTTCMDPSFLLLKVQEYTYKLGTVINKGIKEVTKKPIGDYPADSNHNKRLANVLHTNALKEIYDTDVLTDESWLNSSSKIKSGEKYTTSYGDAYKSIKSFIKEYNLDTPESLDILAILNTYIYTLKYIQGQNKLISGQPTIKAFNGCNIKYTEYQYVMSTECCPSSVTDDENPEVQIKYKYKYEMTDVCKDYGGVFFRWDVDNRNEVNKFCSCAKPSEEGAVASVKWGNPFDFQSNPTHNNMVKYSGCWGEENIKCLKNIVEWEKQGEVDINQQFENIDTQSWGAWWKTKSVDCVTDWHCIADIASIAAYAFGPYGWAISVGIDAISALGYVMEKDEGWKMNAGFTILGALGGVSELKNFAKQGINVSNVMVDIGKSVKGLDVIESRRIIKKILKESNLSESELKAFKEVGELLEKMSKSDADDVLNKLNKQIEDLTTVEKGAFKKYINGKDFSSEKFLKDLGSDKNLKQLIQNILKKSSVKSAVFGGSVFLGMYMFSSQLGDGLKSIYDTTGFDILGIFNEGGELDEEKVSPNLVKLLGDKDRVDYLEKVLAPTISDDQSEKLKKLVKINVQWSRLDTYYKDEETKNELVKEKLAELFILIDDKTGFESKNVDEIVNIVVPQLKLIKEGDEGIIVKLDEIIKDISGTEKVEVSKEQKTLLLTGNGLYETPEGGIDFEKMKADLEIMGKPTLEDLKETNDFKDNKEDMKRLNEEIKRIKSLFNDERLYGNLINEVNPDSNNDKKIGSKEFGNSGNEIDYDEAYEFLGGADGISKMMYDKEGYLVKSADDDICLGANTSLGKIWRKYKSNTSIKFSPWKEGNGCVLSLWKTSNPNPLNVLNLYEFVGTKRFSLYFKTNVSGKEIGCSFEKSFGSMMGIGISGATFNITDEYGNNGSNGASVPWYQLGGGLAYIKLEGTWESDIDGNFTLTDMIIKKFWNKNRSGIKTSFDFPLPINKTIDFTLFDSNFKGDGFEPDASDGPELFKDVGGAIGSCVGIVPALSAYLGKSYSPTQTYESDNIIAEMIK
jgi:hypothetical protein